MEPQDSFAVQRDYEAKQPQDPFVDPAEPQDAFNTFGYADPFENARARNCAQFAGGFQWNEAFPPKESTPTCFASHLLRLKDTAELNAPSPQVSFEEDPQDPFVNPTEPQDVLNAPCIEDPFADARARNRTQFAAGCQWQEATTSKAPAPTSFASHLCQFKCTEAVNASCSEAPHDVVQLDIMNVTPQEAPDLPKISVNAASAFPNAEECFKRPENITSTLHNQPISSSQKAPQTQGFAPHKPLVSPGKGQISDEVEERSSMEMKNIKRHSSVATNTEKRNKAPRYTGERLSLFIRAVPVSLFSTGAMVDHFERLPVTVTNVSLRGSKHPHSTRTAVVSFKSTQDASLAHSNGGIYNERSLSMEFYEPYEVRREARIKERQEAKRQEEENSKLVLSEIPDGLGTDKELKRVLESVGDGIFDAEIIQGGGTEEGKPSAIVTMWNAESAEKLLKSNPSYQNKSLCLSYWKDMQTDKRETATNKRASGDDERKTVRHESEQIMRQDYVNEMEPLQGVTVINGVGNRAKEACKQSRVSEGHKQGKHPQEPCKKKQFDKNQRKADATTKCDKCDQHSQHHQQNNAKTNVQRSRALHIANVETNQVDGQPLSLSDQNVVATLGNVESRDKGEEDSAPNLVSSQPESANPGDTAAGSGSGQSSSEVFPLRTSVVEPVPIAVTQHSNESHALRCSGKRSRREYTALTGRSLNQFFPVKKRHKPDLISPSQKRICSLAQKLSTLKAESVPSPGLEINSAFETLKKHEVLQWQAVVVREKQTLHGASGITTAWLRNRLGKDVTENGILLNARNNSLVNYPCLSVLQVDTEDNLPVTASTVIWAVDGSRGDLVPQEDKRNIERSLRVLKSQSHAALTEPPFLIVVCFNAVGPMSPGLKRGRVNGVESEWTRSLISADLVRGFRCVVLRRETVMQQAPDPELTDAIRESIVSHQSRCTSRGVHLRLQIVRDCLVELGSSAWEEVLDEQNSHSEVSNSNVLIEVVRKLNDNWRTLANHVLSSAKAWPTEFSLHRMHFIRVGAEVNRRMRVPVPSSNDEHSYGRYFRMLCMSVGIVSPKIASDGSQGLVEFCRALGNIMPELVSFLLGDLESVEAPLPTTHDDLPKEKPTVNPFGGPQNHIRKDSSIGKRRRGGGGEELFYGSDRSSRLRQKKAVAGRV